MSDDTSYFRIGVQRKENVNEELRSENTLPDKRNDPNTNLEIFGSQVAISETGMIILKENVFRNHEG